MNKMEKKFWWFSKKNDSASDFNEINNGYYGEDMRADDASASDTGYYGYSDDNNDVSVVLSGDPSKKEPLTKVTFSPLTCADSAEIVDAFKEGKACVICVEELDKPNFLRLFDYLMGAVQALDGTLDRIDRDTVVLLPYGTDEDISIDDIPDADEEEAEEEEYDEDEESEDDGDID
jgi:FtsZ-interacting cell division protein YlmF